MSHSTEPLKTRHRGLTVYDLLALPQEQRQILSWIQRQTLCSLQMISDYLKQPEDYASQWLDDLCQKGFVDTIHTEEGILYQICLISMQRQRRQKTKFSLLDKLADEIS